MKTTTILFDLDGTLLPMDQDMFAKAYFSLLAKKMAPLGYEPKALLDGVSAGIAAMVHNDGSCSNEEAFWRTFCRLLGEDARKNLPHFEAFYRDEFQLVQKSCGFDPRAAHLIGALKEKGYRLVLATNPLFPAIATQSRIRWAGLSPADFELITTYENASFCKPNTRYYEEILRKIGASPEECLMVGNDVDEDMIAGTLGMRLFLLTDCLINKREKDVSAYPHGGFAQLAGFVEHLDERIE